MQYGIAIAIWRQPMMTQEATELSLAKSLCSFQAEHKGLKLWIVSREVATEVNQVHPRKYISKQRKQI